MRYVGNTIKFILLLFFVFACSETKKTSENAGMDYSDPVENRINSIKYEIERATYYIDKKIGENSPIVNGGLNKKFSIFPKLPEGLIFDELNGKISGIPTQLMSRKIFTIKCIGTENEVSTTITIQVIINPPDYVTYPEKEIILIKDYSRADISPVSSGIIDKFEINQQLPKGLSFDPKTGIISGIPEELSNKKNYQISVTNSSGYKSTTIYITVVDNPPSNLRYLVADATYRVNQMIQINSPTWNGGNPTLFISSPLNMPAGLSLNMFSGEISGIPLEEIPQFKEFTITAINSGGESSAKIRIKIEDNAPAQPEYFSQDINYIKGEQISPNILRCAGSDYSPSKCSNGKPTEVTIFPSLPTGMMINNVSGEISGTPLVLSPKQEYTITAKNSGGISIGTLKLGVVDQKPLNIQFQKELYVIRKNENFSSKIPTNSGGVVVNYSIDKQLPNGLVFNDTSGEISGKPTITMDETTFKITAMNSGGSSSVFIKLKILPTPLYSISYSLTTKQEKGTSIEYTFLIKNNSREFDDSSGVDLATPISLISQTTNIILNTDSQQSSCLQKNRETNPFLYGETCSLKIIHVDPNVKLLSLLKIAAESIYYKELDLTNFFNVAPSVVTIKPSRKSISMSVFDKYPLMVDTENVSPVEYSSSFIKTFNGLSSISLDTPSVVYNEPQSSLIDLATIDDDPDKDNFIGNNVFSNIVFNDVVSITGQWFPYIPVCKFAPPFNEIVVDCSNMISLTVTNSDFKTSGSLFLSVGVKEGLPLEVTESNKIDVNVYDIKRIANTPSFPKRMVSYRNNVYFSGYVGDTSQGIVKLLEYDSQNQVVRQVSKLSPSGDDKAYPIAEFNGLLLMKGRNFYTGKNILFVYEGLLNKITPAYPENGYENFELDDDFIWFEYDGKFMFVYKDNTGKKKLFSFDFFNNKLKVEYSVFAENSIELNGTIDRNGIVVYNNKLYMYTFVYNSLIDSGNYKLISLSSQQGQNELKRISNVNGNENNDYLTNGVIYDNKLFFVNRTAAQDFVSSLLYYDSVGDMKKIFISGGSGIGYNLGVYYGKLFFTMPDSNLSRSIFYYDGVSAEVKKVYTIPSSSIIKPIKKIIDFDNKMELFFTEYNETTQRTRLLRIVPDQNGKFYVKVVVESSQVYVNDDVRMFSFDNQWFFSCSNNLESLCTYDSKNEVVSKIADGIKIDVDQSTSATEKTGILKVGNEIFFGSWNTISGGKTGVFKMCKKGNDGCP